MSKLESALEHIKPIANEMLIEHPFIKSIFKNKDLSKAQYAGFLVQIYHLISKTPHYLTWASTNCWDDEWLRDWYMDFAVEERGHHKLCLNDLRKMGLDAEKMTAGLPKFGAQAMVANNFYIANRSPVGLIGFAMATEGMGSDLATDAAQCIAENFDFGSNCYTFLKVHGNEDEEHFESVKDAFSRYGEDEANYELMLRVWEYTIVNYSQLFTDAMEAQSVVNG